ncbi:MAG: rhomboid family intramembrane serine protease [Proteocatella sp.]
MHFDYTSICIANMMVLLFFGSLTEILIGTKKFALLSILTFLATSLTNYFHDNSIYAGHGASGIIWAYHVFLYLY